MRRCYCLGARQPLSLVASESQHSNANCLLCWTGHDAWAGCIICFLLPVIDWGLMLSWGELTSALNAQESFHLILLCHMKDTLSKCCISLHIWTILSWCLAPHILLRLTISFWVVGLDNEWVWAFQLEGSSGLPPNRVLQFWYSQGIPKSLDTFSRFLPSMPLGSFPFNHWLVSLPKQLQQSQFLQLFLIQVSLPTTHCTLHMQG